MMGSAAVDDLSKSVHANNSFHEIRKHEDDISNVDLVTIDTLRHD